jgi:hypothetical protein
MEVTKDCKQCDACLAEMDAPENGAVVMDRIKKKWAAITRSERELHFVGERARARASGKGEALNRHCKCANPGLYHMFVVRVRVRVRVAGQLGRTPRLRPWTWPQAQ